MVQAVWDQVCWHQILSICVVSSIAVLRMSWSIVFCLQATKHRFFFVCLESCQFGSIDATTKLFMLEHAIVRIWLFASWISVVIQIFRTLGFFSVRTWSSAPVRDIFVAKPRETRFANSSLRSCSQFVSGHEGYLNELYMPSSFVVLLFSTQHLITNCSRRLSVARCAMTFYISVRLSTFVDGYFLVHQSFALF